jgi:hypothetical protein
VPFTYYFDEGAGLIRSTATGVIQIADLLAYLENILADHEISPRFVEIVDFEGVVDFKISYSDTSPLGVIWRQYVEKGCLGTVVYAPRDLTYGIARMMQAVIEVSGFCTEGAFRVERDIREVEHAVEFLKRT